MTHSFPTRRSSDLPRGAEVLRSGDRGLHAAPPTGTGAGWVGIGFIAIGGRPTTFAASSGATPASTSVLNAVVLDARRSEEHTSELQSLMRISYAVFCLKKKTIK